MAYRTTHKMAERKSERRRALLSAAIRVFARRGYHAATVPMIVAEAQSSTGSFYFYFRNKEDVLAAALQSLGERMDTAVNESIVRVADPFLQMKAAVEGLMLFLADNPDEARLLIVESSGLTQRIQQVRRIIESHTRSVQNALAGLSGTLPRMDTSVAASCWVGAVYEAAYHWLESPAEQRIPARSVAREVAEFNLRGIGAPNQGA